MKQRQLTSLPLGMPRDLFLRQTEVVLLSLPGPTYCRTLLLNPHSVLNIILLNWFKQHYRWKKGLSTFSVFTDLHLIEKIKLTDSLFLTTVCISGILQFHYRLSVDLGRFQFLFDRLTDHLVSKNFDLLNILFQLGTICKPPPTHRSTYQMIGLYVVLMTKFWFPVLLLTN